jgi:hypothetical protein
MNKTRESFLVRIFARDGSIAGVGFSVSDRHVISCAHVVAQAIPNCEASSLSKPTETLEIDFPFVAENTLLQAKVYHWLPVKSEKDQQPRGDEDIAILEIQGTLNDERQAANLLPCESYSNLKIESYGFPVDSAGVQLINGIPIDGMTGRQIVGGCINIKNLNSHSSGYFIKEGFSGAPIWADESVIGMVVSAEEAPTVAYMLPSNLLMKECFKSLAKLEPELSEELIELLHNVSSCDWSQIYSEYSVDNTSRPANICLAVLDLLRLADKQQGLRFICQLGRKFQHQSLVEWIRNHFQEDYHQIISEEQKENTKTKLLFQVEPRKATKKYSEELFQLFYWIDYGTGYKNESDNDPEWQNLQKIVEKIQKVVEKYCSTHDLIVELVLPRSKFSLDLAQWTTQNGAIFLQYEAFVVLRCLDRFNARRQQQKCLNSVLQEEKDKSNLNTPYIWLKSWKKYSSKLKQYSKKQAVQSMYTLAPNQPQDDLFFELMHNSSGLFVACSFDPQTYQDSSVLFMALDYGTPLAIWFRELPGQVNCDKKKLIDMLRLDSRVTFDALPEHIWKLQIKALKEKDRKDPLYHLTILYDDYESVPQ